MMEVVLIDSFIVPDQSKNEFLDAAQQTQAFIRTLPGFVEGYIYERMEGDSLYNFVTTAVWKSSEAYQIARQSVQLEHQARDFNPQENRKRLNIELSRSEYTRVSY